MRAIAQDRYGGREVLGIRELPRPACAEKDLLVSVKAAGLNPSDWNIRSGRARLLVPYAFPLVLGSDFSGVVSAVGEAVSGFAVGDEVFGAADPNRLGALAEEISVQADLVAKKPPALSHEEAAAMPVVGQTAWRGLFEELQVQAGERLLVLAGGGAVGCLALQLARAHAVDVAATARPRSFDALQKLGASPIIDANSPERFTAHGEFDAIFDTVGAPERLRAFAALRRGGRMVSIAGMPTGQGAKAHRVPLPIRILFDLLNVREHTRALTHGAEYRYFFVDPSGERMQRLAAAASEAGVRAPLDSVFELDRFDAAFERLETGRLAGKVVLTI